MQSDYQDLRKTYREQRDRHRGHVIIIAAPVHPRLVQFSTTRDRRLVLAVHCGQQSICQSRTLFFACGLHPCSHVALAASSGSEELTVDVLSLVLAPSGAAPHLRGRGAAGGFHLSRTQYLVMQQSRAGCITIGEEDAQWVGSSGRQGMVG
jgi:hypothetical protein